jgi:hypothetical protein
MKLFPKKLKACGKGDMTAVKPQKSSEGLTCYVLFDALVHNGSFNHQTFTLTSERHLLSCYQFSEQIEIRLCQLVHASYCIVIV